MSFSYQIAEEIIVLHIGLRFQREPDNMNTLTSFRSIKLYKPQFDWLINVHDSLDFNRARKPRNCGARPVVVLMRVPGEPAFFNVVAPTSAETLTGLGPTLSQLPGEIRNIIYSYLLCTGHPQFLRASKALYDEGSGLMAENGVYRVSFGSPNRTNYLLPSQRIVDNIHNIDICTDLSHAPQNLWLLEAFGEPGRPRAQCSVTLNVHPSTDRMLWAGFCAHLPLLSVFETVVVRAEVNWPEPDSWTICTVKNLMGKATKAWLKQRETAAVPWSVFKCRFIYDLCNRQLKWYFGEGLLKGQDESSYPMVFHPLKAQEALGLWTNR